MQLDGTLCLAELRPWKQLKTEVDRTRIQGIYGVTNIQTGQCVVSVQDASDMDQILGKFSIDFPISGLVFLGKSIA